MWARTSLCLVVLPVVDEVLHHLFFFSLFHTVQVHMSLTGENVKVGFLYKSHVNFLSTLYTTIHAGTYCELH